MKQNNLPGAVKQMQQLHLTGNIIPPSWYKTILYRTKRGSYPHLLAINILADVCYWYRPKEVRDERTGQVKRYEKRFKADKLQRDIKQICSMFGCSDAQAREAVALLEARFIVDAEYRHSQRGNKNWVLYIEPNVRVLKDYTHPKEGWSFDFVVKDDRAFVVQDCELANTHKPQDCELANSKIANSQTSILTENTLTQTNIITLTGNEAAPNGAAKKSPGKKRPEMHLAIDVFLEERKAWLQKRYPGQPIEDDLLNIEWSGKEAGQLKKLGTKLKSKASKAKYKYEGPEGYVENVLRVFLQKYATLNEWFTDEFLPSHIVSHFDRIYLIAKTKTAANGKSNASSGDTAAAYREALAKAIQ